MPHGVTVLHVLPVDGVAPVRNVGRQARAGRAQRRRHAGTRLRHRSRRCHTRERRCHRSREHRAAALGGDDGARERERRESPSPRQRDDRTARIHGAASGLPRDAVVTVRDSPGSCRAAGDGRACRHDSRNGARGACAHLTASGRRQRQRSGRPGQAVVAPVNPCTRGHRGPDRGQYTLAVRFDPTTDYSTLRRGRPACV